MPSTKTEKIIDFFRKLIRDLQPVENNPVSIIEKQQKTKKTLEQ